MTETVECVVIGAGVVGLAIARALALRGQEVIILERNRWIGNETSSRNNEVIHAGFLYPPKSLRGRLCARGAKAMIAYCRERGIDAPITGKLMLALNDDEEALLKNFVEMGKTCGVDDLELLDPAAVRKLEPKIHCVAGLFSPSTGVVDSHSLMVSYQGDAESAGATVAFSSRFVGGKIGDEKIGITVESEDGETMELSCRTLINAAGLSAREALLSLDGFPTDHVPNLFLSKGNYMSWAGKPPFQHIVVPLGTTLMAGGAFTLDTGRRGKFGPDQYWVGAVDYAVPDNLEEQFAGAIRQYWPEFDGQGLSPDYSGIRPRIWGPDDTPGDWMIEGPADHGVAGLVNLFGIETPGLTSSLAIGEYVAGLVEN